MAASEPAVAAEPDAEPNPSGELPAWLLAAMPPEPTTETPALGVELEDSSFMADLPDWLRPPEPEPSTPSSATTPIASVPPVSVPQMPVPDAPAPLPVAEQPPVRQAVPPPAPIAQPVSAAPPVTVPVYSATPTQPPLQPVQPGLDPSEHLQQARRYVAQKQYKDSLNHYQKLIDSQTALDDVIGDMKTVVTAQPDDPRAHRLLGDAHLRKGNLQDALDAYRTALDKL